MSFCNNAACEAPMPKNRKGLCRVCKRHYLRKKYTPKDETRRTR